MMSANSRQGEMFMKLSLNNYTKLVWYHIVTMNITIIFVPYMAFINFVFIYEKDFERMGEGAGLRAIFGPLRPFHYLKKSYN